MCFSGVGSLGSAAQDNLQAGPDAAAMRTQASQEELSANERTRRIRAKGQRFLAEQRVQSLAGGIEQSGSALEVGKADAAQIELDALTELYGGQTRGANLREQARLRTENTLEGLHRKISPSRYLLKAIDKNNAVSRSDKAVWGW